MSQSRKLFEHALRNGVAEPQFHVTACSIGYKSKCTYLGLEKIGFGETIQAASEMSATVILNFLCLPEEEKSKEADAANPALQDAAVGGAVAPSVSLEVPSNVKNPVGFLNVLAGKNHMDPPVYGEIKSAGNAFEIICRFNGKEGVGQACLKKAAKKKAAEHIISMLQQDSELFAVFGNGANVPEDNEYKTNYVGLLNENAGRYHYTFPQYSEVSNKANQSSFNIRCEYRGLSQIGTAKTKKEAKSVAACKVYNILTCPHTAAVPNVDLNMNEPDNKELHKEVNAVKPVLPINMNEKKSESVSSEDNLSSAETVDMDSVHECFSNLSCTKEDNVEGVGNGEAVSEEEQRHLTEEQEHLLEEQRMIRQSKMLKLFKEKFNLDK